MKTTTNNPQSFTDNPGNLCPTCGHFAQRHQTAPGPPGCTFTRDQVWKWGGKTYPIGTCDCPGWPLNQSVDQQVPRSQINPEDSQRGI